MGRRPSRQRLRRSLIALPILLVSQASLSVQAASADPGQVGEWGAPFDLGVIGIHATLLRDGRVLLFDYPSQPGTRAKLWDPVGGDIVDVSLDRKRDLFCSGHSVLPDGRVLVVGGTRWEAHGLDGTKKVDVFDPATDSWSRAEPMRYARWYPTVTELPSGKMLIFSGWAFEDEPSIKWVERYNPANGRISRLPASANMHMDLYPRMFVLPSGDVFWAGEPQATRMLDPASATWWFVDDMNESDRYSGASVLLPGLDRVLAVGGGSPPTQTAEIIDLSEPYPSWEYTAPMHQARKHLNAVLLPDGTMLVVGGGQRGSYNDPVREAELYDPATGTWTEMASQVAGRMYHSTAVLLPDGRVLSAGQDDGLYAEKGEIYSPPYLFKGPRPTIASAPSGVAYGQGFTIATPDAADIARVALIKPGSATHGVNFDQRYVDLAFAAGDGELQATAPADGNEAPPGWYMLFVVSSAGVPSVASWVQWLRN